MKKNIAAVCLHLSLIVVLVCCVGLTGMNEESGKVDKFTGELETNVTLRILENDTAIKQGYLAELIAAFNAAYAEYGITAVDANMDQYTDLANDGPYGYGPDVLYQANDSLMKYVDNKHIMPLPVDRLESFGETGEKAWEAYTRTVDGEAYVFGVPVNIQGPLLYYRKDLLPENWEDEWDDDNDGVCDIVQYWTDLYRYSSLLKQSDEKATDGSKRYGYMRSFLEPYFSIGYLYSYGGYTFGNHNTDASDIGHSAGESEKGGWIIRQLASVMDERCIDDSVTVSAYSALATGEYFATVTTPDVYTLFVDEMKNAGYSDEYIEANLIAADIPSLPASGDLEDESAGFIESKMMGGVQGYAVSSYTKYPNAALAFVNFATSYTMISRRNELLGIVPARADVAEKAGGLSEIINENLAEGNIVVMPSISEVAQIWTPLQTFFQDIAKDPFRTGGQKYDTLDKIKQKLIEVDRQIYNAIFTLA